MWHVSCSKAPLEKLRRCCLVELAGVGRLEPDWNWWEEGQKALHLRRRLLPEEEESIGPPIDVRATPEAHWRYRKVINYLPKGYPLQ